MKRINRFITLAALLVAAACSKISPEADSGAFVTLTDAVPDAILEIRYYGTYNFVGARIDGYEQSTAMSSPRRS